MEVVYAFCETARPEGAAAVRIPFFDYDKRLFYLLKNQGGVWNNNRREFVFPCGLSREHIWQIITIIPYIQVNKDPFVPLKIFGFMKRPWEEMSKWLVKQEQPAQKSGRSANLPAVRACPSSSVFSMPEPPLPEQFSERWQTRLETELRSRKYSLQTRRCYLYFNRLLCRTLQKPPEAIQPEDITRFLAAVEKDKEYSASSLNLALSAIKFFYRQVLKKGGIAEQRRPRQDGRLPQILSKEEIKKIISMEKNVKHRLLLMLVYSSGLRVSEVVALKKESIDFSRKVIYIKQGKGRKDRYTLLSDNAAGFIKEYCVSYGIQTWLFPGQPQTGPLTIRTAQHIVDKALRRAEIKKKISIHGLRHTFATHLLESGTDIRYIQELLGHTSIRTTERYTHVAKRNILAIKSPLDTIF